MAASLRNSIFFYRLDVIGLILLVGTDSIFACSTVKVQHGKELLYGHNLNNNGSDVPGMVFINKRGVFKTGRSWSELINKDQRNPSAVSWISRYGFVSFNTFGKDFPDGGMNETGIHVWKMGLSNSEVIYPKNDQLPRLNQMHWMQYILDNAATLNEAIACAHQFEIDGWGWPFFMGDKEGLFLFAKAALDQNKMALTLNGLETEYGTFELVCREQER